jgi:hypothetical protein
MVTEVTRAKYYSSRQRLICAGNRKYDAMDATIEDDEITLLRQSRKFLKELGEAFESIETISAERELQTIIRKVCALDLEKDIEW